MGHTPGSWRVFPGSFRNGIEADKTTIVMFSDEPDDDAGVFGPSKEEAIANAHLIAAAPDLLECLELAMAAGDLNYKRRIPGQNDEYCDLVDTCNAAIAAAKQGE